MYQACTETCHNTMAQNSLTEGRHALMFTSILIQLWIIELFLVALRHLHKSLSCPNKGVPYQGESTGLSSVLQKRRTGFLTLHIVGVQKLLFLLSCHVAVRRSQHHCSSERRDEWIHLIPHGKISPHLKVSSPDLSSCLFISSTLNDLLRTLDLQTCKIPKLKTGKPGTQTLWVNALADL